MKSETIQEMQDELFQRTGQGWFRVLSSSMDPLIEINDRILIQRAAPAEIRLRDVILFKSDDVFIAHRVIGFDRENSKTMVLQKGDASADASLIAPDSVVGKVTAVEKKGKALDLTSGRGRMLNGFLGMKSCIQYRLAKRVDGLTERTRNTQGFISARAFYRIIKKPFNVFQRILVKLCS